MTEARKELEKFKDIEKTMKDKETTITGLSANIEHLTQEIEQHKRTIL